MSRRTTLRNALSLLVLALAGCQLSKPFDLDRDVEIDESHGQSVALLFHLDLAEAGPLRDAPSALSLESVDVTVTQVDTAGGANDVRSVNGALRLRPDGAVDDSQDVAVGRFAGLAMTPGATAHLPGNSEVGKLLLAAHHGTGRFKAAVALELEGGHEAHLVLWISLHVSADYDTGP